MNSNYDIGLSALLESDISTFEYFNTLPTPIKNKIEALDLGSFDEIQRFVASEKHNI